MQINFAQADGNGFLKSHTLKENKDFRRLYYRGKSMSAPTVVTYAMKSRCKGTRIGITTSKKIGNAVERNRSRRVIRAAFSQLESRLNGNWDIVFVARTKTSQVKMQDVLKDMQKQLLQLGVINEKN
jgi:ribonuclease P protein component